MAKTYRSKLSVEIPLEDVPTFIFSSGTSGSRRRPQYFDADHPSRNFSLGEAEILVRRLGKGLQDLKLQPDDKVLLYAGNSLYFPILFWGIIAAGCIFTGCTPGASVTELAYQLQDSNAVLLLTSSECIPNALEAAKKVGLHKDRIYEFCDPFAPSSHLAVAPWTTFWATEDQAQVWTWRKFKTTEEAMATTAAINYSSGTTGLPKGVELSHYNLVANTQQFLFKRNLVSDTPEARARRLRLDTGGERWLAPMPMYHAYGQTYFCMTAARSGVKAFIMPKYDIKRYLTYLDIYRITFLTGLPTLLVSLSKHPDATSFNLTAIEQVVTGSAPLNPAISALVGERLLRPDVKVKQVYGLTECTSSVAGFAPDDYDDTEGKSVGWLNPNISAKIVPIPDRNFGAASGADHPIGELWVSGPNVMKGYYNKPKETAATFVYEDGHRWIRTGDIGYFDDRGRLYIIDRLKELIKVKGLQVAPAELEQALLLHTAVLDAAVVGFKTNDGEYPRAYVVKKPGQNVTSEELQKYIQDGFSRHKWLTAGVEFIDIIPRTASGKVVRRMLPQSTASSSKL